MAKISREEVDFETVFTQILMQCGDPPPKDVSHKILMAWTAYEDEAAQVVRKLVPGWDTDIMMLEFMQWIEKQRKKS